MIATDEFDDVMPLGTTIPLAVVEPSSRRLVRVNAAFGMMLGVDPPSLEDVDLGSLVHSEQRPRAESLLSIVSSGTVDFCRGHGTLRRPDGRLLPVVGWIGRLTAARAPDRALLAVLPAAQTSSSEPTPLQPLDGRIALGVLDHDWRFAELSPDAGEIFGWPIAEPGPVLLSLVHPDDAPPLLLAMGRSSAERAAAAAKVRVRGPEGTWPLVRFELSPLCRHHPPRFAVAVRPVAAGRGHELVERNAELETVLSRILAEAEAVRAGRTPASDDEAMRPSRAPGEQRPAKTAAFTPRQIELLHLAAAGLPNQAIAERLSLSLNTVRSQFQRLLTKLGAHSKLEAVAIARQRGVLQDP